MEELIVHPQPPYDFRVNAEYVTHFRGREGVDSFDGTVFARPVSTAGGCTVSVTQAPEVVESDGHRLKVSVKEGATDVATLSAIQEEIERVLGAHGDPTGFYDIARNDPSLRPLTCQYHGLHIPLAASLFEALAWAVLGQQISAHAAKALRTRVIERYGAATGTANPGMRAFPGPEALADADLAELRALGLSKRKAEYLTDIAHGFASGKLTCEHLKEGSDEEVAERLRGLRGVGPWTAQWILLRGLGREDAFPAGDVALQRVLGELVRCSAFTEKEVRDFAESYRPYRGYLTVYVFAVIRSRRAATTPGGAQERA
ncbi:MAG: DNA-3-methyladenine glycosylase 2 [Chloroflexota bacterium]